MKSIRKIEILCAILGVIFGIYTLAFLVNSPADKDGRLAQSSIDEKRKKPINQKILQNDYHVFQSFNNCAPAALSMALSYFGIQKSQEERYRPYLGKSGI